MRYCFFTMLLATLVPWTPAYAASPPRVDLAEFADVVRTSDENPAFGSLQTLTRGEDGWEAWKGPDGQFMIALAWPTPRDICEASIEFRHAIANRHRITVQYWQEPVVTGLIGLGNAPRGRWLTPVCEWWAGDRDVHFQFTAQDREPGTKGAGRVFRRSQYLRILCGPDMMPPVRYLRAYGPEAGRDGVYDIRPTGAGLDFPLLVTVDNGSILGIDGRTTLTAARIRAEDPYIRVRYLDAPTEAPNATLVVFVGSAGTSESLVAFHPVDGSVVSQPEGTGELLKITPHAGPLPTVGAAPPVLPTATRPASAPAGQTSATGPTSSAPGR